MSRKWMFSGGFLRLWRISATFLLLMGCVAKAGIPPTPKQWVTDNVGLLTPDTRKALNEYLEAYEARSKHQVFVWIGQTSGGTAHSEWALRTFNAWGLGRAGRDDGIGLFVFTKDDMRWLTVGYGLEAAISDREATRICREVMAPLMRAGKPDQALRSGVELIVADIDAWEKR